MNLTTPELVRWSLASLLEVLVFALALRRRLQRFLPVFTLYLSFLVFREAFIFSAYRYAGYTSPLSFYAFWITQALLLVGRAASIGELAWCASQTYPGFRVILKWLMSGLTVVFLTGAVWVGIANASHIPSFVLSLERHFELAAAVILLTLLFLSSRYQISLETFQKLIAVGLLFYSLIQVLNNTVSRQWLQSYFHWGDAIRIGSFHATLLIWLAALAKPLPQSEIAQAVPLQPLRHLMRQGTEAMRELLTRLTRLRKRL